MLKPPSASLAEEQVPPYDTVEQCAPIAALVVAPSANHPTTDSSAEFPSTPTLRIDSNHAITITSSLDSINMKLSHHLGNKPFSQLHWSFDRVLDCKGGIDPRGDQRGQFEDALFATVGQRIVDGVLEGKNGLLVAYGQSGTGKSVSLFGSEREGSAIVKRSLMAMHRYAREAPAYIECNVTATFVELHNEKIRDLLAMGSSPTAATEPSLIGSSSSSSVNLSRAAGISSHMDRKIRVHPEYGTCVEGITRKAIVSPEDVDSIVELGRTRQALAGCNSVLQVQLKRKDLERGLLFSSSLFVVELAGSERPPAPVSFRKSASGSGAQSPKNVQLSLQMFRRVIDAHISRKSFQVLFRIPGFPAFFGHFHVLSRKGPSWYFFLDFLLFFPPISWINPGNHIQEILKKGIL